MLLSQEDVELFFKLNRAFMCFVNERLRIVPGIDTPDVFSALPAESRIEVRNGLLYNPDLIQTFVDQNPYEFSEEDLDIVLSWQHHVAGRFFVFRYLKKYTVFISTTNPPTAYGVVALTEPLEQLVGPHLPFWTETLLLPFKDKIVYDGILGSFSISFGGGVKRSLNESYKITKERQGIVTQLPVNPQAVPAKQSRRKSTAKPRAEVVRSSKEATREVLDLIVGMINSFCWAHLNDEYAELCLKLAEKLARKRPSPLLRGNPSTWASGIVRTIGWVNFLHDPSQNPHLRLMDIDEHFGIAESTGAAKLKEIRTTLRIRQLDPQWTLPSKTNDNPLKWTL